MATVSDKVFSVIVRDRSGIIFDGQVRGITAYNPKGAFDVLPIHTNFITILRKKLILHKLDGSKQEINLEGGVMRVLLTNVEVFIGVKQ